MLSEVVLRVLFSFALNFFFFLNIKSYVVKKFIQKSMSMSIEASKPNIPLNKKLRVESNLKVFLL